MSAPLDELRSRLPALTLRLLGIAFAMLSASGRACVSRRSDRAVSELLAHGPYYPQGGVPKPPGSPADEAGRAGAA